jgi:hypothetical protein
METLIHGAVAENSMAHAVGVATLTENTQKIKDSKLWLYKCQINNNT